MIAGGLWAVNPSSGSVITLSSIHALNEFPIQKIIMTTTTVVI